MAGGGSSLGDGGLATEARLSSSSGVAVDGSGNLYIAESEGNRIRKVDASTGIISTIAGTGREGYGGDGGPATAAQLYYPVRVALDAAGNIYIADVGNDRIRKVDASTGIISTVAGTGRQGYSGDGGPATAAQLAFPFGVALDGAGNLYIADAANHRIRRVDAGGTITTVVGTGQGGFSGDGGPATAARLLGPIDIALDGAGSLYIADLLNHRIRRVRLGSAPPPPVGTAAPRISQGGVVLATGTPVVNFISPNALVSVFGQEFAPEGTQVSSPVLDAAGGIAANLADTCLEIDGQRAPLFAVFSTQINAQAPHDMAPGQVRVQVIHGCGTEDEQHSPAATAAAAAVSPAFFNFQSNPNGRNPIVALHGGGPDPAGAPDLGAAFTPAKPGEIVTLYGTGFGATEPPLEAGRIPGMQTGLAGAVSFTFGGIAVPPQDVFYAGAAPCCAGLYQFVVRVPPSLGDGDAAVIATVNGVSTPVGPFLAVRRQQ